MTTSPHRIRRVHPGLPDVEAVFKGPRIYYQVKLPEVMRFVEIGDPLSSPLFNEVHHRKTRPEVLEQLLSLRERFLSSVPLVGFRKPSRLVVEGLLYLCCRYVQVWVPET